MIAADYDGRGDLTALYHFIERQTQTMTLPQAHPANARRQSLKMESRARHIEPLMQVRIVRNQLLDLGVGLVDILRITRQGHPAKGADAAAKQRPNVFGNEARYFEGVGDAGIES